MLSALLAALIGAAPERAVLFPVEGAAGPTRALDEALLAGAAKRYSIVRARACADDGCRVEAATRAKASIALVPVVVSLGAQCELRLARLDLSSGTAALASETSGDCDELAALAKRAATKLASGAVDRGKLEDGRRHGPWSTQRADGTKLEHAVYDHGLLDGERVEMDEEGEVRVSIAYAKGVREGRYREWARRGELRVLSLEGLYAAGRREGVWTRFDEEGRPLEVLTYSRGEKDGPYALYRVENGRHLKVEEGIWRAGKKLPAAR